MKISINILLLVFLMGLTEQTEFRNRLFNSNRGREKQKNKDKGKNAEKNRDKSKDRIADSDTFEEHDPDFQFFYD